MSSLITTRSVESKNHSSRLQFATEGGGSWSAWDRFITLDGKKAHHIGNICNTCAFFFERMDGAVDRVTVDELADTLRDGIADQSLAVADVVADVIPAGKYTAMLLRCVPRIVEAAGSNDYFREEQIELWGVDPFWGVPHYPRNEYYRVGEIRIGEKAALFEFMVPMFPSTYLDPRTSSEYENRMRSGKEPTALAVSILDVKGPADWQGEKDIEQHWCLAHYLLDGHHKVWAAAQTAKPVSVLSFLALEHGISTLENRDTLMSVLKKSSAS